MAHSYVRNCIHIIFSTKNRVRCLTPEVRARLWDYITGIIRNVKAEPIAVGGHEDHSHILLEIPSTLTLAKAVQLIKANSSKWLSETFLQLSSFEWQEGYGVFSVSTSMLEKVTDYIEGQEVHHRKRSFQEEYIAFLKGNNIEYDERYILG
jgi:putative transposase